MYADLGAPVGDNVMVVRIDGGCFLSTEPVAAIAAVCERAEDGDGTAAVVVHVSGAPDGVWARDLTVQLVNKWEQALRRLERLPAATIAVATGDCGGMALDALLATDHRIAAESARLVLPVQGGLIWPGMALYRLARQVPNAAAVRQAVLFGGALGMREALAMNLVHEVTDDLSGSLAAAVERVSTVSGSELAVRRQLTLDAQAVGFEDALGVHLAACDRALRRVAAGTAS
ncbi:enoyl-CoA-hydratase DpgB [Plantactinospora solaniradicis]|uniref:Enoyl-CoA-hydratase DpgB n=1 Tax=Plantactinospora solaniradicis TaxID=1723736 RepID=A0ABW1K5R4_9ACTN